MMKIYIALVMVLQILSVQSDYDDYGSVETFEYINDDYGEYSIYNNGIHVQGSVTVYRDYPQIPHFPHSVHYLTPARRPSRPFRPAITPSQPYVPPSAHPLTPTRRPPRPFQPHTPTRAPSQPHIPSPSAHPLTTTKRPSTPFSPHKPTRGPYPSINCTCVHYIRCYDEGINHNVTGTADYHITTNPLIQKSCSIQYEICCYNPVEPTEAPAFNQSAEPDPHKPTQAYPEDPPNQLQPTSPPELSPVPDVNCTCTPLFRCYDEETSSNLTGIVDDSINSNESCPNPSEVCCYNVVEPTQAPGINDSSESEVHNPTQVYPEDSTPSPSPGPQPTSTPELSSVPDVNCTCTPFFRCYDEETSSNLTGAVDDRIIIRESCPNPNDVCCYNPVEPTEAPAINQSSEPEPYNPTQAYPEDSTLNPSLKPQPTSPTGLFPNNSTQSPSTNPEPTGTPLMFSDDLTESPSLEPQSTSRPEISINNSTQSPSTNPEPTGTSLMFSDDFTQSPSLEPQPTSPPELSLVPDVNCTCTPFFRCYDEETSSSLTDAMDDRAITNGSCPNPNDVCCFILVEFSPLTNVNSQLNVSQKDLKISTVNQPAMTENHGQHNVSKHNQIKTPPKQHQLSNPSKLSSKPLAGIMSSHHQPLTTSSNGGTHTVEDIGDDVLFPVP